MFALITLHMLSAVIWVGGMFFAYVCLRPIAAKELEPAQRLTLWQGVFSKFFPWVWATIALLIISGHGMIAMMGGFAHIGTHVHIMLGTGYVMIAIFGHLFFSPYKKLSRAVAAENWLDAGIQLNIIRKMVGINLLIGLATVAVAAGGRYLL